MRVVQLELCGEGMWIDVGEIVNACFELEELNIRIGFERLEPGG